MQQAPTPSPFTPIRDLTLRQACRLIAGAALLMKPTPGDRFVAVRERMAEDLEQFVLGTKEGN